MDHQQSPRLGSCRDEGLFCVGKAAGGRVRLRPIQPTAKPAQPENTHPKLTTQENAASAHTKQA